MTLADSAGSGNGQQQAAWTITPVALGSRRAIRSWFNYLEDRQEPILIAYHAWVISDGSRTILVDTGPSVEEAQARGFEDMRSIVDVLPEHGIDPETIDTVILTHLHWDHASAAIAFPKARFHVQQAEIDFFLKDAWDNPATSRFFSHRKMLTYLVSSGRAVAVDGSAEPLPGIRLMKMGGHTPGSQIVVVATRHGLEIITGDLIPMNRNYTQAIPTGILVDLLAVVQGRKLIRAMRPYRIYTGHDPEQGLVCDAPESAGGSTPGE